MQKSLLIGIFCMIAVLALPALAAQPEAPADGLTMNKGGKKEVIFNHSTHKAQNCADCHHSHPAEAGVKDDFIACASAGCHDNLDPKDKSNKSYHQIIHKRKGAKTPTCLSCHLQTADAEKKKELTACSKSKCHP